MIAVALLAASIYWHLPILVVLVSVIYSATRFDDWEQILQHAWRGGIYVAAFMGTVFVVLLFLSSILPAIF